MGGQASILYGGADFSKDVDFAVAVAPADLKRLRAALDDLRAEPVFFPALSREALLRGHACHFRCRRPELGRVRVDVMAVMRGVDPFPLLWRRRLRVTLPGVGPVALLSLHDLVRAKKTQRDKDWPMIRRMIEADIAASPRPRPAQVRLWLAECRTARLLIDLCSRHALAARSLARRRPALRHALRADTAGVERQLRGEEQREREADRRYWAPLRRELEAWRLQRRASLQRRVAPVERAR